MTRMGPSDRFSDARTYSLGRLEKFRAAFSGRAGTQLAASPICVYITGSFGRLEALSTDADLDLFFLHDEAAGGAPIGEEQRDSLIAAAKDAAASLDFPELTERFLEVHELGAMERALGSPQDDMDNAFTARMLLLLESRPALGDAEYERMLDAVIDFYYRDFEGHEDNFVPTFLQNDVLRYWRTLCLNYEQKWALRPTDTEEGKALRALDNLKLRFNRLWTCFSFIVPLAAARYPVLHDDVVALAGRAPCERFREYGNAHAAAADIVEAIIDRYANWIERASNRSQLKADLMTSDARSVLRLDAAGLGDQVYELMLRTLDRNRLRPLIV